MKKAENAGHVIDSEIIAFIAERISQNIRELEGSLSRLLAYSDLMKAEITLELVKNIISISEIKPRIAESAILNAVSEYYQIDKKKAPLVLIKEEYIENFDKQKEN